jgi:hypothetical protein
MRDEREKDLEEPCRDGGHVQRPPAEQEQRGQPADGREAAGAEVEAAISGCVRRGHLVNAAAAA